MESVVIDLDLRGDALARVVATLKAAEQEQLRRAADGGGPPPHAPLQRLSLRDSAPPAPPPPPAFQQPSAPHAPLQHPSLRDGAPPAPPPPPAFQQPAPPPPTPGPRPAPAAAAPSGWELTWSTDPADHNRQAVTALAHCASIDGLPGGDGHAGWLVSASPGLLNLYECAPGGGVPGLDPGLLLMHSQESELAAAALEAEPASRLLLAASADRAGGEALALHSLDAATLLAPQPGRAPMPPRPLPPGQRPAARAHLAAASLHPFGGALARCAAASYGGGIVVWHVGELGAPGDLKTPKAAWRAHAAGAVTALHRSRFGLTLWSAGEDGLALAWPMRERPTAPATTLRHGARLAGVVQTSDAAVVTAGADGRVCVWDVRRPDAPRAAAAAPDGAGAVSLAVSPFGDAAAVATAGGAVFAVDLLEPGAPAALVGRPPGGAAGPLAWQQSTGFVCAAGRDGSVSVFRNRWA